MEWKHLLTWGDIDVSGPGTTSALDLERTSVRLTDEIEEETGRYPTLADAFEDLALVLSPTTAIRLSPELQHLNTGDWPFADFPVHCSSSGWANTGWDSFSNEGDWWVEIDDTQIAIQLWDFAFDSPQVDPRCVGTLLAITMPGVSRTTGDIGTDISIDQWGGAWFHSWGVYDLYLGVGTNDPAGDLLHNTAIHAFDTITDIEEIRSDVLSVSDLAPLVERIAATRTDAVHDETAVAATDWYGTIAELRGLVA